MYEGFLELGGVEIGNRERVRAYVDNYAPSLPLRRDTEDDGLHVSLEDEPYRSPLLDDAPWVDVENEASHDFLGIYPLSVKGIGDSTRTSSVTESIVAGGVVEEGRHATREIRVRSLLIGKTELAAEMGLAWLRKISEGASCGLHTMGDCSGSDLRFFLARPEGCYPLYRDDWSMDESLVIDTGSLEPGADIEVRLSAERRRMPARMRFDLDDQQHDGLVVRWGKRDLGSNEILEEHGPLIYQRTNLTNNPSFDVDGRGWIVRSGTAALRRQESGGADGGAFGRISDVDGSSVRTNWIADPQFQVEGAELWPSNGVVSVLLEASPSSPSTDVLRVTGPTTDGAPLHVETIALGPLDLDAPSEFSFQAIADRVGPATVTVINNFGQVEATLPFELTTDWARRGFSAFVARGYTLRITAEAPGTTLRIATPMLEARTNPRLASGDMETLWPSLYDLMTNYIPNPRGAGSTSSFVNAAAGAVSMVADTATGGGSTSYALSRSSGWTAGASQATLLAAQRPTVVLNQRWWALASIRFQTANALPRRGVMRISHMTAEGVSVSSTDVVVDVTGGAPAQIAVPITVTDAAVARIGITMISDALNAAADDVMFFTDLVLTRYESESAPGYFDGNTTGLDGTLGFSPAWSGEVDGSTSSIRYSAPIGGGGTSAAAVSSTKWKRSGARSVMVSPLSRSSSNTFYLANGFFSRNLVKNPRLAVTDGLVPTPGGLRPGIEGLVVSNAQAWQDGLYAEAGGSSAKIIWGAPTTGFGLSPFGTSPYGYPVGS